MIRELLLWVIVFCFGVGLSNVEAGDSANSVLLAYGERLEDTQQYDAAISEFKRFMFFHPEDPDLFRAYYGIGRCYRQLKEWKKSVEAYQTAMLMSPNEDIHGDIALNLIDALLEGGRFDEALLEIDRVVIASGSATAVHKASYYRFVALVLRFQWIESLEAYRLYVALLDDSSDRRNSPDVDSLLRMASRSPMLSEDRAVWFSTFLPGLGQLYSGDAKNAVNAFGLNVSLGYFVFDTVAGGGYVEGALLFSSVFLRYYLGNRYHAGRLALEENRNRNKAFAGRILQQSLITLPERE